MFARVLAIELVAFVGLVGCGARTEIGLSDDDTALDPCGGCAAACISFHCTKVTQVAVGGRHSCALLETDDVMCWGSNEIGILGTGTIDTLAHKAPTTIEGLHRVVEITTSETHACARHEGGTVSCWGSNTLGQLGRVGGSSAPLPVSGIAAATHIGVGRGFSCASTPSGVFCWGDDAQGQLGDRGVLGSSPRPVRLEMPADVASFALGSLHGCAVTTKGEMWCWGSNALGRLASPEGGLWPPRKVSPLGWVTAASSNVKRTCAARIDGGLSCWGDADSAAFPNETRNAVEVGSVALGGEMDCIRSLGGKVTCGSIVNGDFGAPTFSGSPRLESAASVSAGAKHGCAVLFDGAVECFGDNALGQLGDGTTDSRAESGRVIW